MYANNPCLSQAGIVRKLESALSYKDEYRLKKRRRTIKRILLWLFSILGILSGGVYVLFFSGALEVSEVKISKPETLEDLNVEVLVSEWLGGGRWGITRRSNIAFLKVSELADSLTASFPRVSSVDVKKGPGNSIEINLKDREPVGIWCFNGNGCFYFDKDGIVYERSTDTRGFLLMRVSDLRQRETPPLGTAAEGRKWLEAIFTIKEFLPSTELAAREFVIPNESFDEFRVIVNRGFYISFSFNSDIGYQLKAFSKAWNENIPSDKKSVLEYVDLRVPDRIYYKSI